MGSKELSPLETLFKDHLDGKTARIHSGGFYAQGSMELPCILSYQQFYGLRLRSELKWNASRIIPNIHKHLMNEREDMELKYSEIEKVIKSIDEFIEPFIITVGSISPYGVKSFSTELNIKGYVSNVKIEYENGSIVELYVIK